MNRILHRCNTFDALERGFREFDGAECDVRFVSTHTNSLGREVVLQHGRDDPPAGYTLRSGLKWLHDRCGGRASTLAINVKDTDMAPALAAILKTAPGLRYFLFDVPGVELPEYEAHGLRVFGRYSLYETQRPRRDEAHAGFLVDAFNPEDQEMLVRHRPHASDAPCALISNRCHGSDLPNYTEGVSYLIGKVEDFV